MENIDDGPNKNFKFKKSPIKWNIRVLMSTYFIGILSTYPKCFPKKEYILLCPRLLNLIGGRSICHTFLRSPSCSPEDPSSTDLRLVASDTVEVFDPVDGSRQEDSVSGSLVRSGRDYLNGGLA